MYNREENPRNYLGYGNAVEHQKYKFFPYQDDLAKGVIRGNVYLPVLGKADEPT